MSRFAILEHDHPVRHWDFLIEIGPMLRAWRLAEPPLPGRTIAAQANADHRLLYLDYEGEVRGGRGRVICWDRGEYEFCEESAERVVLRMHGSRLRGQVSLEIKDGDQWLFDSSP